MNIVLLYILISYSLSLVCLISQNELLNALAQASPLIAVLTLVMISRNKISDIKSLGIFSLGKIHYYNFAIILPLFAIVFSFALSSSISLTKFTPLLDLTTFLVHYFLLIFMWPLLWAFTEEIGWRGFLQPKLINIYGIEKGIFFTGLIWAMWHYTFIFTGNYYLTGNLYLNAFLFTITITLMSFTLGWLKVASKSIWPCVIFHSASNAALQMCSPHWKPLSSNYIYVAGEAGIANIVFWAVAFVLIKKTKTIKLSCNK